MTVGTAPVRVQRQRTKGWRMPPNTVYVGRGSKWGNPFALGTPSGLVREPAVIYPGQAWEYEGRISWPGHLHPYYHPDGTITRCVVRDMTPEESVCCYEAWLDGGGWPIDWTPRGVPTRDDIRAALAGKNLACWCPPERACHADVLLRLANT